MIFVVLMGAPGAGKGTQAKLLQTTLGLPQIATGDLFRENLRNQTELGKLAQRYMDAGELVPDEVTVAMVKDRLGRDDCQKGAILDGFPRNISQAAALNAILTELDSSVTIAPYIHVDFDILIARLLKRAEIEGRADDNEETIRTRMRIYREQTAPLLAYFEEQDLLARVNGDQEIRLVNEALAESIKNASEK